MKNKKNLVAIIALFLVIGVCISTYAIYRSTADGTATATAAAWTVYVNDSDIVTQDTFTFSESDIEWDNSSSHAVNGKIAPGSTGRITVRIDAGGAEVPVVYDISASTATPGFTVNAASGSILTGTISAGGHTSVDLEVVWEGSSSDDESKNQTDVGLAGSEISIPVTVTATQQIN